MFYGLWDTRRDIGCSAAIFVSRLYLIVQVEGNPWKFRNSHDM